MKTIVPSSTVSIQEAIRKKMLEGVRIYNFAAGDPVLDNHPAILKQVSSFLAEGRSPYPPVNGLLRLRSLGSRWINQRYGASYAAENVLVTNGGKFALYMLLYSLLASGDRVLLSSPYWVSYPNLVRMAGGEPIIIPTTEESRWKITAQDLIRHATKSSKILILNNGTNPTGVLYTRDELKELLSAAKRLGIFVLSDEVYSELAYDSHPYISAGSFPEHREHVAIVESLSKNFAMSGWRVGFVIAPAFLINRISEMQGQTTTGVPLVSQWAAIGALEEATEVTAYVKHEMLRRRNRAVSIYNQLFQPSITAPSSALYLFIPLRPLIGSSDSIEFCKQLIESAHVACVPGAAFGVEGYIRIAFTPEEAEIEKGLHMLRHGIDTLNKGKTL